ncbi:hypothetical protein OG589_14765 [Sphaerisporangium sp. NBC_01403]|uniref:hypothetical protein n=1 Tax=Sphaerisporangium sp. NBC_01403 TaxID=2903599 RepID=UPI0032549877
MTLPTCEQALASAREGSPFSNGTEGYAWMENNCERCVHDAATRRDDWANGCPLILVALLGKTPAEWLRKDHAHMGDQYTCIYFRDEDDGGPGEPTPIPDPPGQEGLFPRDEFERPCLMFADTAPRLAERETAGAL